jgi:hypothetical protein
MHFIMVTPGSTINIEMTCDFCRCALRHVACYRKRHILYGASQLANTAAFDRFGEAVILTPQEKISNAVNSFILEDRAIGSLLIQSKSIA